VHGATEHLVGLVVADKTLLLGVPAECLLEPAGDVGQQSEGRGLEGSVDIGDRSLRVRMQVRKSSPWCFESVRRSSLAELHFQSDSGPAEIPERSM